MSDEEVWRRDEVESPCVRVCVLHPETERCIGCHRTRDEIARWSTMSPSERREVMRLLTLRAAERPGRRGGRAGRLSRHQEP